MDPMDNAALTEATGFCVLAEAALQRYSDQSAVASIHTQLESVESAIGNVVAVAPATAHHPAPPPTAPTPPAPARPQPPRRR